MSTHSLGKWSFIIYLGAVANYTGISVWNFLERKSAWAMNGGLEILSVRESIVIGAIGCLYISNMLAGARVLEASDRKDQIFCIAWECHWGGSIWQKRSCGQ
jgi:hypothetical protein